MPAKAAGRAYIGISGYEYKPWRDRFYPPGLAAKQWLHFASRRFNSIEINGTFYSLKSPAVFAKWRDQAPPRDFLFALKGGRFITHNLKLRRSETALPASSRWTAVDWMSRIRNGLTTITSNFCD